MFENVICDIIKLEKERIMKSDQTHKHINKYYMLKKDRKGKTTVHNRIRKDFILIKERLLFKQFKFKFKNNYLSFYLKII